MTNDGTKKAENDAHSVTTESTCPDIEMGVIVGNAGVLMAPKQFEGMHEMAEEVYGEPPGFLFKCCCPPCAVAAHEGLGGPCCVAFALGWCFTLFCWTPKQGAKPSK